MRSLTEMFKKLWIIILSRSDAGIWYCFLGLNAVMLFSIAFAQIFVCAMFLLLLGKIINDGRFEIRRTDFDIPFILFVLARFLSIVFSTHWALSSGALLKEIVFYIVFFIITSSLDVTNQKHMRRLMLVLFIAAIFAAIYGSAKYLLGFADRASSTSGGYYTLGIFLIVIVSMAFIWGQDKRFISSRLLWILGCSICMLGILFTFNRVHWIELVFLLTVIALMMQKRLLFILFIAIVALFAVPALHVRAYETLNLFSHMAGRDIIWRSAAELSTQHPFLGFGPRTFRAIFPHFDILPDKGVSSWHNDYIGIYMESGIAGLGTLLWLLITVYRRGIQCYRRMTEHSFERTLIIAVLFGISSFLISGLAGVSLTGPLTSLFFWELLAIVALMNRNMQLKIVT